MNIMILGAGNMGLTYAESIIHASLIPHESLYFVDRNLYKAPSLATLSANPLETEPSAMVSKMDLIVISVKPQDFAYLANQVKPFLQPNQLVLSLMAGVKLQSLAEALGVEKVLRAMPNLPAQVSKGMTVFTAAEAVSRLEVLAVQNILNTTGKSIYTQQEELIDAATAISGSGPAFVFFFMQSMIDAALEMGFEDAQARLLVQETFEGALNLVAQNELSCQEWIKKVSSKGGTTEAAMAYFDQQDIYQHLLSGVKRAKERAVELSNQI